MFSAILNSIQTMGFANGAINKQKIYTK